VTTPDAIARLARLPLAGITRAYPHKLDHVVTGNGEVTDPRTLHPAFYGCYDWHSAVHGHWALVRVLRRYPDVPDAVAIRAALDTNLTADHLAAEAAYFAGPYRQAFERTYGWAWLLELARELDGWDDPDGARWAAHVAPLAGVIVERWLAFLPRQAHPIRSGGHANTAFGLALALDYARQVGAHELAELIVARALSYFGDDVGAPAAWEPGGEDFLSPALVEADLMRHVVADFPAWLARFLPALPASLQVPVEVGDRSDPKLAHLDGLNLSRAWCLRAIAGALPAADPRRGAFAAAAAAHARAGLAHVATGDYMGEHWLATFALYLHGVAAP
jgi:hypothetical protein